MRETLNKLRNTLRPIYGYQESRAIIRSIFQYLKGWDTVDLIMHEKETLSPFLKGEIDGILQRLLHHEPIQYITGEARFNGLNLKVEPGVLIPRPETSELVDLITDDANGKEDLEILDVATGSGCIAVALGRNLPFPKITAIDISGKALEVARENASALKVKVDFIQGDIFTWSPDREFDIIVSNPPYIDESEKKDMEPNVLEYEPAEALFVPDDDPLRFYHRINEIALKSLRPGGKLYYEINPRHASRLKTEMEERGFGDVSVIRDTSGKERFIKATKQ